MVEGMGRLNLVVAYQKDPEDALDHEVVFRCMEQAALKTQTKIVKLTSLEIHPYMRDGVTEYHVRLYANPEFMSYVSEEIMALLGQDHRNLFCRAYIIRRICETTKDANSAVQELRLQLPFRMAVNIDGPA